MIDKKYSFKCIRCGKIKEGLPYLVSVYDEDLDRLVEKKSKDSENWKTDEEWAKIANSDEVDEKYCKECAIELDMDIR